MSETLPKLDALWRDYCDDFGLPSWGDVIQWLVDMPRVRPLIPSTAPMTCPKLCIDQETQA